MSFVNISMRVWLERNSSSHAAVHFHRFSLKLGPYLYISLLSQQCSFRLVDRNIIALYFPKTEKKKDSLDKHVTHQIFWISSAELSTFSISQTCSFTLNCINTQSNQTTEPINTMFKTKWATRRADWTNPLNLSRCRGMINCWETLMASSSWRPTKQPLQEQRGHTQPLPGASQSSTACV